MKLLRPLAGYTLYDHKTKRLRTPWTTDWIHTGQDRWIQTELAFTLAKNATKPNPFEIISLQTTRKENNWKIKEKLARAVVTVETERIKGSNPWCLWWWWWQMGNKSVDTVAKFGYQIKYFVHGKINPKWNSWNASYHSVWNIFSFKFSIQKFEHSDIHRYNNTCCLRLWHVVSHTEVGRE
jgi:hypothetical protein